MELRQLRGWVKVERPYCNIPSRCYIRHCLRQTVPFPFSLLPYIPFNIVPIYTLSPHHSSCPYLPLKKTLPLSSSLPSLCTQLGGIYTSLSSEIILIGLAIYAILFSLITTNYIKNYNFNPSPIG